MKKVWCVVCMILSSAVAMQAGNDEIEEVVFLKGANDYMVTRDSLEKILPKLHALEKEDKQALSAFRNYCIGQSRLWNEDLLQKHGLMPITDEMKAIVCSAVIQKNGMVQVKKLPSYRLHDESDKGASEGEDTKKL